MPIFPTKLERVGNEGLLIHWSNDEVRQYTAQGLRDVCPCATCREKRGQPKSEDTSALPVLSVAEARPTTIEGMRPVGNYAYTIAFSDGHDTGIFNFEFLRSIGEPVKQ